MWNCTILQIGIDVANDVAEDAGDIYIKGFAKALQKVVLNCDYIGRIGGDEFCVIYEHKISDIEKIMSKINELFKQEMKDKKWEYETSFAYGYAHSKELQIVNIEELIKIADERMYERKQKQKSIVS